MIANMSTEQLFVFKKTHGITDAPQTYSCRTFPLQPRHGLRQRAAEAELVKAIGVPVL
jgi:hypothetical protein